ncbi:hypothetical protein G6011_01759 [Alternaria panax]|uniref:Chromo domain-containing protein n=1 Tax=Alternaria panax TaxID=48097 RepID=A0AAD4IKU9_9PLEO|nr:hypothetical protein G6011_01759 [Alternaria panax]
MSGKEPRGSRGIARGKGRGKGKTQTWTWESYTPGVEVYEQLWRVRKEPAIVTARLPDDGPIANARTRILCRRQTEGAIKRERYTVEITYTSQAGDGHGSTEVEDVDLGRIMQFVSPAELERYETEQFRLEAEAEAIAIRTEAEDLARRQLHKNVKGPNTNRGSRMLSGPGLPVELPTQARGGPRGSRGRGRERSRGLMLSSRQLEDDMREELVDSEPITTIHRTEHIRQPIQPSPGAARSAFVANSALPVSPIPRRLSTTLPRQEHGELSYLEDDVGLALTCRDGNPMANASVHLRDSPAPTIELEGENIGADHPCTKSGTLAGPLPSQVSSPYPALDTKPHDMSSHTALLLERSSVAAFDSDDTIPAQPPLPYHEFSEDVSNDTIHIHTTPSDRHSLEHSNNDDEDAEGAEEYLVEAIVEHFQEHGKNYYLVKWEGYENSHDWLPEQDLEGAADLVAEYKERVGRKNKKVKKR